MDTLSLEIALGDKGPGETVVVPAEDLRRLLGRAEEVSRLEDEVPRLEEEVSRLRSEVERLEAEKSWGVEDEVDHYGDES